MSVAENSMSDMLENDKKSNDKSFFQRNKMTIAVLGLAALTGGAFAAIYVTAATTIPLVIATAAKIGLDIAALETVSTLAASATIAATGAAALAAVYAATSLVTSTISSAFNWLTASPKTPEAPEAPTPPASPKAKKELDTSEPEVEKKHEERSSNTKMNEIMPPQDSIHTSTPVASPSNTPVQSRTGSRSSTPEAIVKPESNTVDSSTNIKPIESPVHSRASTPKPIISPVHSRTPTPEPEVKTEDDNTWRSSTSPV